MAIAVENVAVSTLGGLSNYSNSGAGRIVVLLIGLCSNAACSVSAVSGAGLTWNFRSSQTQTDGSGAVQTQECWWAYAASQITSQTLTVTDNAVNTRTCIGFSVTGVFDTGSPWDGDPSLPVEAGNIGSASTPTASGISWDNNDALVITHQTTRSFQPSQTAPSGYTAMGPVNNEPGAGGNRTFTVGGYKVEASAQSGVSLTGSPSETPWLFTVDVLAGGAPPPPVTRSFGVVIS